MSLAWSRNVGFLVGRVVWVMTNRHFMRDMEKMSYQQLKCIIGTRDLQKQDRMGRITKDLIIQ